MDKANCATFYHEQMKCLAGG